MAMDYPLMSTKVPYKSISLIENFEREELDERFHFLFPKMIHRTHWKYDYIIFERKFSQRKRTQGRR